MNITIQGIKYDIGVIGADIVLQNPVQDIVIENGHRDLKYEAVDELRYHENQIPLTKYHNALNEYIEENLADFASRNWMKGRTIVHDPETHEGFNHLIKDLKL